MDVRKSALLGLAIGDIFRAQSPSGASVVCLVTLVSGNRVLARRIYTQEELEFDRQSGDGSGPDSRDCRIDSVAPLPPDVHDALVALDRRYGSIRHRMSEQDLPDEALNKIKLTPADIRAGLFIGDHYDANPI